MDMWRPYIDTVSSELPHAELNTRPISHGKALA